MSALERPILNLSTDQGFYELLTGSYARLVGKPLVLKGSTPSWLYHEAPFVVLAHNTDPDPHFIYANEAAQACFGYSWDEFTRLPSRMSAESVNQAERQAFLNTVARDGFASGYSGVRITKSGRRFCIESGLVWELIDQSGMRHGQAATFPSWQDV